MSDQRKGAGRVGLLNNQNVALQAEEANLANLADEYADHPCATAPARG